MSSVVGNRVESLKCRENTGDAKIDSWGTFNSIEKVKDVARSILTCTVLLERVWSMSFKKCLLQLKLKSLNKSPSTFGHWKTIKKLDFNYDVDNGFANEEALSRRRFSSIFF